MLIVMRHNATPEEVEGVVRTIEEMGYENYLTTVVEREGEGG